MNVIIGVTVKEIPEYLFCTNADYNYGDGSYAHITSLTISNSVLKIGDYAFNRCYDLVTVNWGNLVQNIGKYAFSNCINIRNIIIPQTVTAIGNCAFWNCKLVSKLEINAINCDDTSYNSAGGSYSYYSVFYNIGSDSPSLSVIFGSTVKEIPAYLFATAADYNYGDGNYAHITSVEIPASVTAVGKYAFMNCFDLTSIGVQSRNVSYGDYAFNNLPNTAHFYCYKNSTTATLAQERGCAITYYDPLQPLSPVVKNTTYTLGSGKYTALSFDGVSGTVAYAPKSNNAKSVTIPATVNVNGIVCKVTQIKKDAFKNNSKLTKVTIGNNVTSIGANAFSNCSKLKTVKMGSKVTSVGTKAFYGCKKLVSFTIGKNVTTIGTSAFQNCTSLKKVTIPSKVKKIGAKAFYGCKKMASITIKTTKLTIKNVGKQAFTKTGSSNYKKLTVKVPKKQLKAYKTLLKKKGLSKEAKVKK